LVFSEPSDIMENRKHFLNIYPAHTLKFVNWQGYGSLYAGTQMSIGCPHSGGRLFCFASPGSLIALHVSMVNIIFGTYAFYPHRSYRTLHFLRLFSVSSCLKITHCDTYSGRIWKDFVHQCKVLNISSVFLMKIPQDSHRQCFLLPKSCRKLFTDYPAIRRAARNSAYSGYPELWILRYPAHRYRAVPSAGFEPTTLWLRVRRPNNSATVVLGSERKGY
jgi:hypothetical protein